MPKFKVDFNGSREIEASSMDEADRVMREVLDAGTDHFEFSITVNECRPVEVDPTRDTCWFCGGGWGHCTCKFWHDSGEPPTEMDSQIGFDFDGEFFITQPNVGCDTIYFVDPVLYYGDAFVAWYGGRESRGPYRPMSDAQTSAESLPRLPSALLRLAVADSMACEQDPSYVLEMTTWMGRDSETGRCQVCMAGAVLARTLGIVLSDDLGSADGTPIHRLCPDMTKRSRLWAIDQLRIGMVQSALECLSIKRTVSQVDAIDRATYVIKDAYNARLYRAGWATYLEAARILEEVGL